MLKARTKKKNYRTLVLTISIYYNGCDTSKHLLEHVPVSAVATTYINTRDVEPSTMGIVASFQGHSANDLTVT